MDDSPLSRLFVLISAFGIISNLLNFRIFISKTAATTSTPIRQPYSGLLACIAVCDLACCSYYLAMNIISNFEGRPNVWFLIVQFAIATLNLTSFCTCVFLAICYRVKRVEEFFTTGRTCAIIVSTSVALILLNVPTVVWSVVSHNDYKQATSGSTEEGFYDNELHKIVIILNTIVFRLIPFVVLTLLIIVLTTFELRLLCHQHDDDDDEDSSGRSRIENNRTLILLALIFTVTTEFPSLLLQMTYDWFYPSFVLQIIFVTDISKIVQLSSRFFVYYLTSRKFRKAAANNLLSCRDSSGGNMDKAANDIPLERR